MTSERSRRIAPSPMFATSSRAAELRASGRDIVDLGAEEPDFETPEHIKSAARDALARGETRYTAADGTPELKDAIVRKFERENGLRYEPDEIIVSCGAKHSIYNLMQAVLDPGDEILVPTPYWVSYTAMASLAEARTLFLETTMEQGFKITPSQLDAALSNRTRMVILNSPANPTGVCYTRQELEQLGDVLRRHERVLVASDDIYEHIHWKDTPFCNFAMACPDLRERCIVINGVSKAFAMTGWRIGYAAAPAPIVTAMRKLQSQSTSNPNSIAQAASVCALDSGVELVERMVRVFEQRHRYVLQRLTAMRIRCLPADGTFYLFPEVRGPIDSIPGITDDVSFTAKLLDASDVAVVPGTAFGCRDHVRISIATDLARLQVALDRIEEFLERCMPTNGKPNESALKAR